MMRCKSNEEITLPIDNIIDLLYDRTKDELNKDLQSFTQNFSLAFLGLGLPRHKNPNSNVLPCLIHLLEASPPTSNQSAQISHMLLEWIKAEPAARSADERVAKAVAKGEDAPPPPHPPPPPPPPPPPTPPLTPNSSPTDPRYYNLSRSRQGRQEVRSGEERND